MKSVLLIVALFAAFALGGCSNMTPRQQYTLEAATYDGIDIALTAANASGKIPAATEVTIQADEAIVVTDLNAAAVWIQANPQLADTVGAVCPPLSPLTLAVQVFAKDLAGLNLVPVSPPATARLKAAKMRKP